MPATVLPPPACRFGGQRPISASSCFACRHRSQHLLAIGRLRSCTTSFAGLSSRTPLKAAWRTGAVAGPAAKIDLDHHLRLDPDGVAPPRCSSAAERRTATTCVSIACSISIRSRAKTCVIAGAGPAGIAQFAVVVGAEHQRADRAWHRRSTANSRRPRIPAVGAFGLDPVVPAPERYGASARFETMPSSPIAQACCNIRRAALPRNAG